MTGRVDLPGPSSQIHFPDRHVFTHWLEGCPDNESESFRQGVAVAMVEGRYFGLIEYAGKLRLQEFQRRGQTFQPKSPGLWERFIALFGFGLRRHLQRAIDADGRPTCMGSVARWSRLRHCGLQQHLTRGIGPLPDCRGIDRRGLDLLRECKVTLQQRNLRRARLNGATLEGLSLDRSTLRNASLKGAHAASASLEGADLRDADLRGADLRGANLCSAKLDGARLHRARLAGATFDLDTLLALCARGVAVAGARVGCGRPTREQVLTLIRAGVDLSGTDLRELDLSDVAFVHREGVGIPLKGADLRGAKLRGADLRWTDLHRTNLEDADLTGARLHYDAFQQARLNRKAFDTIPRSYHQLAGVDLCGVDLHGLDLRHFDLRNAMLRGANLEQTDLSGSRLQYAVLDECNLTGANLSRATLMHTKMRNCSMVGVTLQGSNLHHASLHGSDLQGADLTGAVLSAASFTNGILRGVDLQNALLLHAHFTGADLTGATLPAKDAVAAYASLQRGQPVHPLFGAYLDHVALASLGAEYEPYLRSVGCQIQRGWQTKGKLAGSGRS